MVETMRIKIQQVFGVLALLVTFALYWYGNTSLDSLNASIQLLRIENPDSPYIIKNSEKITANYSSVKTTISMYVYILSLLGLALISTNLRFYNTLKSTKKDKELKEREN